jgi:predicted nucleotidyltransferase
MLLTRSLSREYLSIYGEYGGNSFTLGEASRIVGKEPNQLRKDMYVLKNSLSLVSVDRGRYRLVQPEKWIGLVNLLSRFPDLKPLFEKLLPYIEEIDAMFLYGSRARGDYKHDSDYDILIFTGDSRIKQKVKRIARGFENITIEVFLTHKVEENLKLDPLFLASAMREAMPIFGEGLRRHFLRIKTDKVALISSLDLGIKRLKGWEGLIEEGLDPLIALDILHAIFLRIRQAFLTKALLLNEVRNMEEMLEEFSGYYKDKRRLEELYEIYRAVRDEREVLEFRPPSKKELAKLFQGAKRYIRDMREFAATF